MRPIRLVAIMATLAIVAAACGGGNGDGDGEALACEAGVVDGDLRFYNWSDYIDPDLIPEFEAEYGIDVIEGFFDSNEAMLAQLNAGTVWDLVVPSDYMVGIMIEEGLLHPLQRDAIPNLDNLDPDFADLTFDPGGVHSVPYQYGLTGIGVNLDVVGEDFERSWALLLDPEITAGYPGGISVLNDPREAMGAALKWLGYSLNETDPDRLQEAADVLRDAQVTTFDSDQYATTLVTREVAVSHGYSGGLTSAIAEADNPDRFVFFVPDEGGTLWVDNMVIPANAESPCSAHVFIDFILDAEVGQRLSEYNFYPSPNQASQELIDPELMSFYDGVDADTLEVIEDTGDAEILFTDLFAQARS